MPEELCDKVLALVEENKKLKEEIEVLKSINFKLSENLVDEIDERIIDYVKKNPGKSKKKVTEDLSKYGAYTTLRRRINNLSSNGFIKVVEINSNLKELYLNYDILTSIYIGLDEFKKVFCIIIESIRNSDAWGKKDVRNTIHDPYVKAIMAIYNQLIIIHITLITSEWIWEVRDPNALNKVYALLFSAIKQLNKEIFNTLNIYPRITDVKGIVNNQITYSSDLKTNLGLIYPDEALKIILLFKSLNLHRNISDLLNIVWNIGFPLFFFIYREDFEELSPVPNNRYMKEIEKEFPLVMYLALIWNGCPSFHNHIRPTFRKLFKLEGLSDKEKKEIILILGDIVRNDERIAKIIHNYNDHLIRLTEDPKTISEIVDFNKPIND